MKEKAGLIVFFPVQPHVYKFLQAKCGEKLVASKKDFYGNIILDLFNKRGPELRSFDDDLTYPVEISLRYLREYGIIVDKQVVYKFNDRLDNMMREELRTYVSLSNIYQHVPKDEALRQFMRNYDLTEDDIKFETLKKDLSRKLGTKKIFHDLSLQKKP